MAALTMMIPPALADVPRGRGVAGDGRDNGRDLEGHRRGRIVGNFRELDGRRRRRMVRDGELMRCAAMARGSSGEEEGGECGRRGLISGAAAAAALGAVMVGGWGDDTAEALQKAPKGFSAVLDSIDGYAFLYPFGWQEVAVKGQDVAFKDVIEPLESVSVSIVRTDKTALEELGSPDDVARALVGRVLSSPTQRTTLKDAKARVTDGKTYYEFEFMAEASNFTRHALGAVALAGGKFYTLTTGANERRWGKVEDKLRQVVDSFTLI